VQRDEHVGGRPVDARDTDEAGANSRGTDHIVLDRVDVCGGVKDVPFLIDVDDGNDRTPPRFMSQ